MTTPIYTTPAARILADSIVMQMSDLNRVTPVDAIAAAATIRALADALDAERARAEAAEAKAKAKEDRS